MSARLEIGHSAEQWHSFMTAPQKTPLYGLKRMPLFGLRRGFRSLKRTVKNGQSIPLLARSFH
jgi:hypothetical protein